MARCARVARLARVASVAGLTRVAAGGVFQAGKCGTVVKVIVVAREERVGQNGHGWEGSGGGQCGEGRRGVQVCASGILPSTHGN